MENKTKNKTIGLCLSGGGHRASIFSLGALLYLVDAGRKDDIKVISSVSGGSLTSAFLAAQSSSLHKMTPDEFEGWAANWAHQIAGRPKWWLAAIIGYLLLALGWLLLVCTALGWLPIHLIPFTLSWWKIQIVYVAALCVLAMVGHCSDGTFWGWWGTWLYLGILLPFLFLPILVWAPPMHWFWRLLLSGFCVFAFVWLFAQRARIADFAFRAKVRAGKPLCKITAMPRHVFCATDMERGDHVFFSHDFICSKGLGLAQPRTLLLSTAAQASANFPVAFPDRRIKIDPREFKLCLEEARSPLVLSDGGVRDNFGIIWFDEASDRNARFKETKQLARHSDVGEPQALQWIEKCLDAMEYRPDHLLVVNSSYPVRWKHAGNHHIPFIAELASLVKLQSVMHENYARASWQNLQRRFFFAPSTGGMVSIEQHPQSLLSLFRYLDSLTAVNWINGMLADIGLSDLDNERREHFREHARATKAPDPSGNQSQQEREETETSLKTPTTFRPLGVSATSKLLRHGYLNCMSACCLLLDGFPYFDDAPTAKELSDLACGIRRERYPSTRLSASAAH